MRLREYIKPTACLDKITSESSSDTKAQFRESTNVTAVNPPYVCRDAENSRQYDTRPAKRAKSQRKIARKARIPFAQKSRSDLRYAATARLYREGKKGGGRVGAITRRNKCASTKSSERDQYWFSLHDHAANNFDSHASARIAPGFVGRATGPFIGYNLISFSPESPA